MARLTAASLLLSACLLGQSALAAAADPVLLSVPDPAVRPRIALVLSGGGARGFAHIGVLRALREQRIPVDMVVGTSMGSVVGGAYAAGASLADLERMARETDWDRVVADRPAREDLEFRRREEDLLLPSRIEFGLHRDGLSLPPSAAGNAALEHALGRLLPLGTRDRQVDQLALPFRSVASDLVTGELVDLVDTPLFLTVRASLAVPGVFAPVRVRQRLVVDGGLVRNLPVDLARRMGADIVIAVNVGTPLAPEKTLGSALGVAQQMINILTEQNVQRSIKELQAHDILVAPDLAGVGFLDFRAVDNAIGAGERATRALAQRLAPLALGHEAYAAFESGRLASTPPADKALPLGRVAVQADGGINPKILEVQSGLREGQPATNEQVRSAAQALYGRGDLERVEADIRDVDGRRDVTIRAREAPWADSRLRVGLELGSDFDDANSFALRFMHVRTSINAWGAELRTMLGVGDQRQFGMEFFQPLGPGSQWYLAPSVQYNGATYNIFDKGRRRGRAAVGITGASLIFGRELGAWGDINIGVQRLLGRVRIVVPDEGALASGADNALVARYRVDTLDSLAFPSRGVLIDAEFGRARDSTTDVAVSESALVAVKAFRYKEWAGHVYGEFAHAHHPDGLAPSRLGGFLRLSGTEMESIYGRNVALLRLVMARRIGTLPLALGGTVRAGFSLEAGGGFEREATAVGRPFKQATSGFVSVDTRFGPVYFGAGATRSGERTLYLYLGPFW